MEGFVKYLNIADEVDIMIYTNNNQSMTLSSFVYEVRSDEELVLSNPIREGVLYPMEKSYTYYFRFFIENSGMFLFKGKMMERIKYDHLPSVVIRLESEIKRIQRRKFYRVNLISVGYFLIERRLGNDEIEQLKERMRKKYKNESDFIIDEVVYDKYSFDTIDISGGGLRVYTNHVFEVGDFVIGEFKVSDSWVKFKGELVRVEKKDNNRHEVGIKFLELDSNTQSKIVAYVFEVERNLIKKGLI